MSAILLLSFDEMDNAYDASYLYPCLISGNSATVDPTTPFGSGKSIVTYIGAANGDGRFSVSLMANQAGKTLNFGFHAMVLGFGVFFSLHSVDIGGGLAQQIALRRNGSGYLELFRGSTLIATGTTYIAPDVFVFYQVTALIDNDDGAVAVRLNGNPVPDIDFSGDTQHQSVNSVMQVAFGNDGLVGYTTIYLYQLVAFNSDGTTNNGLVPVKLTHAHLHPVSDGAEIWTPNAGSFAYTRIDELSGAPNDADYVKTSTLSAKNRCLVGPASSVGEVAAVQVLSRYNKPVVGAVAVKSGVIAGASEAQSVAKYLPSGLSNYNDVFEYKTGTTKFAASDIASGTLEVTSQVSAIT
jgi:hypothetical protein